MGQWCEEALSALEAGADGLKIFPAEMITPKILKSWKVILPENTMLFPVGGIEPDSIETYVLAGATGFGIGSALYHPGKSVLEVVEAGKAFKKSWEKLNYHWMKATIFLYMVNIMAHQPGIEPGTYWLEVWCSGQTGIYCNKQG